MIHRSRFGREHSTFGEAVIAGEHSLKVNPAGVLAVPVTEGVNKLFSEELNDNYLLTFWAKGRGTLDIYFEVEHADGTKAQVPARADAQFSKGIVSLPQSGESSVLAFFIDSVFADDDRVWLIFKKVNINESYYLDDTFCRRQPIRFMRFQLMEHSCGM